MNHYHQATEKEQKQIKNVAMLFSGGLDSTYLLWKNLKEGHRVTPYYNEILNNTSKSRIEKQQMAKIIGMLRQEFGDRLNYPRYAAKAELYLNMWSSSLKFKQTPIWLLSTLYMDQDFDEIQIGYVANDDSISYLKEIQETYKALGWMLQNRSRPELTFPLYQTRKFEMLDQLPYNLKQAIFSCENPIIMDEKELMHEDGVTYYRGSLIEFFEKDNENRPVFLNHEPCGECDPCRKILTQYYSGYVQEQPIYKKIKMKAIMSQYDELMKDIKYDEKAKSMFDNITRVHGYRSTIEPTEEMWKAVELLHDERKQDEIVGGDVMAKDEMVVEPIEKLEVEGNDGLVRDHWTDVSFR